MRQDHADLQRLIRTVLSGAVALVFAACSADTPSGLTDFGLIPARHPVCQQQGQQVARFLDTGKPSSMEPQWGNARQRVASLQGDARLLSIRQVAGEAIFRCDQVVTNQERQARAQQQGEAQAELAEQSPGLAAQQAQRFQAACQGLGARVTGIGVCQIDYPEGYPNAGSLHTFDVPLNLDGSMNQDLVSRDQQFCQKWLQQNRGDWWHSQSGVCAIP